MAQPTNLPRFADVVSGDTTKVKQPPSAKQDSGWAVGEKPAAQHMNWLLWTIYLWIVYLKNLAGEAFTWTAAHVFNGTVNLVGHVIGNAIFDNAPTAPDYHIGSTRTRVFLFSGGGATSGTWTDTGFTVVSTDAGAVTWNKDIYVESGETISAEVLLQQSVAVAGGTVSLYRINGTTGAFTLVASVAIANATGLQGLLITASHSVVFGAGYFVQVGFAAGAGTKNLYTIQAGYVR